MGFALLGMSVFISDNLKISTLIPLKKIEVGNIDI